MPPLQRVIAAEPEIRSFVGAALDCIRAGTAAKHVVTGIPGDDDTAADSIAEIGVIDEDHVLACRAVDGFDATHEPRRGIGVVET